MPRLKQMPRPGEKEVDPQDAELLAQVEACCFEGSLSLSPEEQKSIESMETDLYRYGKLSSSKRKMLKSLARRSER